MKNLLLIPIFILLIGAGIYIFAHETGGKWHHGGNIGHHAIMMENGNNQHCGYDSMKNVKMNIEKNDNGVTIKMTSEDKEKVKFLQQHAKLMKKHHDNH